MPDNKEKKDYLRFLFKMSILASLVMLVASLIWLGSGIVLSGYKGDDPEVQRWLMITSAVFGPASIIFPDDASSEAFLVNALLWVLIFFVANVFYALLRRIVEILKNGGKGNPSALFLSVSTAAGYGKAVTTYIVVSIVVFFALSPLFIYLNPEPPSRKAEVSTRAAEDYTFIAPQFVDGNDKIMFHYNSGKSNVKDTFIYEITGNRLSKPKTMNGREYPASPRFSRDGKKITFASNKDGGSNIYVMNADGSNMRQLTFSDGRGEKDGVGMYFVETNDGPSFSPDGKRIIFKRSKRLNVWKDPQRGIVKIAIFWDIYEMDLETGRERRLTKIQHFMSDPYYLSDGKRFVFWTSIESRGFPVEGKRDNSDPAHGIFVMDGPAGPARLIVPGTVWIPGPQVSWDDKILFRDKGRRKNRGEKDVEMYELFIFENGKRKQVTRIGAVVSQFSISGDGSRAVFTVEKDDDEDSLWIVNTDGTGLRQITVPWDQLKQ